MPGKSKSRKNQGVEAESPGGPDDGAQAVASPPAPQQLPAAGRGRGAGQAPFQAALQERVRAAKQGSLAPGQQQPRPGSSGQQQQHPGGSDQKQQPRSQGPPAQMMQQMSLGGTGAARTGAQGGALRPPKRKDTGTAGRKILLSANHFAVVIQSPSVFHYDVDVSPMPPRALFRKVILQWMATDDRMLSAMPVFDMKKNIYTAERIPGVDAKMVIKYTFQEADREKPRDNNYAITLQPTGEVEVDLGALADYCRAGTSTDPPLRPIQALDIALKYGAQKKAGKVQLGSCILSQPLTGRSVPLGGGVEVWFGHFQSLRLAWKPFLNVDATQRAFVMSGRVQDIMDQMYNDNIVRTDEEFSKKIAMLKVTYSRGTYMATVGCNGIKGPANKEKFDCEGKMVTVQQYFEKKLGKKLQHPNLPCVWVGSREKRNLVPMELCSIPAGQEYRRKLTDIQTSNMIKVAATPPDVRRKKILEAVRDMNFNNDAYATKFGISVDDKMVQFEGRVLPPPKLVYGRGESSPMVPKDGTWNMRNLHFIDPRQMQDFGVINITHIQDQAINTFIGALVRAGRGMAFGTCHFVKHCKIVELERNMQEGKKRFPKLQIMFVVIHRKGDPAYEIVKKVGDLDLNMTSQCIQFKNVLGRQGPDPATMANICLKLNAKLGGINNLIHVDNRPHVLLKEQVIIMGADVTHPGADQQESGKPSIAAVVASVDPRAAQYACETRIQASKQEYIEEMEDMVYQLLLKFYRSAGKTSTGKPQRIIFYRDGVSEGQFAKVLEWELSAIRKACMRLEKGYNPPITFVVVQKRHHTRLFPDNPRDECGRGKNVPPGTVVDTTIVHPTENDFFLVSHLGIQGTSRPTHYHLLWDDSNFSADALQMLTYYLCYVFVRCTRSVSYPAPCYYSHLVAFRGRQYFDNLSRNSRHAITAAEFQEAARKTDFMYFV